VARPTGRSTGRSTASGTPSRVKACVFGVLGNHDTAHIVPGLEAIGIRMLLKENELMRRGGPRLRNHLYGREARHCYGQHLLAPRVQQPGPNAVPVRHRLLLREAPTTSLPVLLPTAGLASCFVRADARKGASASARRI
jgi:hypothetical protein